MTGTLDIPLIKMVLVYSLLIIPFLIMHKLKLKYTKQVLWAILRMTVQLTFVGLYLNYIFEMQNFLVTLLWIVVMLTITNFVVINRAGLKSKIFFAPTILSISISTFSILLFFVPFVISPNPTFDARYMIPVAGMVLGNALRANVISLERFYSSVHNAKEQHLTYLMMGASLEEAIAPHFRAAAKVAISPIIATIATAGISSLPGMMTGQILGGTFPIVAIKYQIAIMICIFTVMAISTYLNIRLSIKRAFDEFGMLREDIFE